MMSRHRFFSVALASSALLATSLGIAQQQPAEQPPAEAPVPPEVEPAGPAVEPPGEGAPATEAAPGEAAPGEAAPGEAALGEESAPVDPAVVATEGPLAGQPVPEEPAVVDPAAPQVGAPAEKPPPSAVDPVRAGQAGWGPSLGGQGEATADEVEQPEGPYVPHWMWVDTGYRAYLIFHDGFDPFSEDEVLGQGSLSVGFTPLHAEPFGFGLTAEYDVGRKTHHVRFIDTSLTLHHIGLGLQAHAELGILRLFARATPGVWYGSATIDDQSFDRPLVSDGWTWGFDASGGVAIRIASVGPSSNEATVRFWLLLELGWGFAGQVDMAFAPEEDDEDPRQFGSINLPAVRPTGMINRFGFAVSF